MVVSPGFIDIQSHSRFSFLGNGDGRVVSKVTMGVTTEIMGESTTNAPSSPQMLENAGAAVGVTQFERFGEWIEAMVGRPLDQEFPPRSPEPGPVRLVARGLTRLPRVRGVDLELRAGEVVGLAGLVGSGRTEVARLLFGADRASAGTIELDGERLELASPRDAVRAGIALVPEDRKQEALLLGRSLRENFTLASLDAVTHRGLLRGEDERRRFAAGAERVGLRYASEHQPARGLSGGNQQKLVLARWLERDADVLIFDEPTRGIDVGARYDIYVLIRTLAEAGKALLVVSSDLPEVLGICDRVVVLHEGRVTGERPNDGSLTQAELLELALGEGVAAC